MGRFNDIKVVTQHISSPNFHMMNLWCLITILLFPCAYSRDINDKKGFSVFNIVKFSHYQCISTSIHPSGFSRYGTCFTESECEKKNGTAFGSCASGFGVCCVFVQSSCDSIVNENITYVSKTVNDIQTCKFNIQKVTPDAGSICSLRLDFEIFSTIKSLTDSLETNGGTCTDTFIASVDATGDSTPTICGENSGQHVYLDFGNGESNQAVLEFTFDTTTSTSQRKFEISVSQIECTSIYKAPLGCLQYHYSTRGRLTTFNFDGSNGHLASQRYNICLKHNKGFCCVKYQVCDDESSYTLHNANDDGDVATLMSLTESYCANDFIIIEGSSSTCSLTNTVNRYCGEKFSDVDKQAQDLQICDCTPPYRVTIVTDDTNNALGVAPLALPEEATLLSRGLCLTYTQIAC